MGRKRLFKCEAFQEKRDEKIVCCVNVKFPDKEERNEYHKMFCCDDFKSCDHYQQMNAQLEKQRKAQIQKKYIKELIENEPKQIMPHQRGFTNWIDRIVLGIGGLKNG